MKEKISKYVFQAAIGILFGYFGILALLNPDIEAAKWVSANIAALIKIWMPIGIFMIALGLVQIILAALFITNTYVNFAIPISVLLLTGIIINIGFNEIALRDFVILTGLGYFYFENKNQISENK